MRKFVAIFLLGCLLFLLSGYHVFYSIRIAEAKDEMKKEMLHARIQLAEKLVFSAAEMASIDWEDGDEFRYRGEMYDVLKTEHQDGKTIIWCLADTKETALLTQYINAQKRSSQNSSSDAILKILSVQYLPSFVDNLHRPVCCFQTCYGDVRYFFNTITSAIITPPPRTC